MHRRAYVLLLGVATLMGLLALLTAFSLGKRVVDPEGFLGPSWLRLPLLLTGAFVLDVVPRTLWASRMQPQKMLPLARAHVKAHWTRDRIVLVVMGLVCFYVTYVSYRNLKSFLPEVRGLDSKYDRELHQLDQILFLGQEPAVLLQAVLGADWIAHVLSFVYLAFLPLVPLTVTAWLIWSRNVSFGYWFATSQCFAWSLGTASYYVLPTLGPGFQYPWLYEDLATTGTTSLMDSLFYGRSDLRYFPGFADTVQSVAGFASLHVAITLLLAMMAQYTVRNRIVHWVCWVNFAITVVATLYFGWHYVADDIGGVAIAFISFYLGALATGQKFDRRGRSSHPTTTTSVVPVDAEQR